MANTTVNPSEGYRSKSPLYQQIYQLLRQKILEGQWRPDEMLPSEASLMKQYNVSRATVRQALDELVSDGLIYRRQGRGTFVAPSTAAPGLVRLVGFTEDMLQRGLTPATKLISASLVPASDRLASALQSEEGEPLARIERLRLADGVPIGVEIAFWAHRHCPGILTQDYTTHSLREMLKNKYQIRLTRARQQIQAAAAAAEMAEVLDVVVGFPLLTIERVSYSEVGVPMEFLQLYYRSDRYALHADLRG